MIKKAIKKGTNFNRNESMEGESIEDKMDRVLNNGEPIDDTAAIIHTTRSEGVRPEYDIRTDRFELAIEAMDSVGKSQVAKRVSMTLKKEEKDSGESSTQATE